MGEWGTQNTREGGIVILGSPTSIAILTRVQVVDIALGIHLSIESGMDEADNSLLFLMAVAFFLSLTPADGDMSK